MNEAGMASGEWHKANDHLKSLITEDYVLIERKDLESQDCNHYARFMVLSNHDAPIRVEIGNGRIVCLDVSPRCKNNFTYFDQLGEILEHPDTPGSFMSYLLSLNLSEWKPCKISLTKMKIETMRDQLPNPIRFIIDFIADGDSVSKQSRTSLYQKYLKWCGENGEKPLTSKVAGKKFSDIGDMEEFSDIPQPVLPENEITDILISNVPEIIPPKIIPTLPEKNTPPPSISKNKKADKQDNLIQALFDYITGEVPVTSTSGTSKASKTSETIKLPDSPKLINEVVNMPSKETSDKYDPPEPINQISSAILLVRQQRKDRLRKRAVELGEDPDVFVTITKKDRLDSIAFRDRIETDSQMCGYAEEVEEDPKEYMDMTIRERLIEEEIICHSLMGSHPPGLILMRNGKKR
ncbi:hypothetical protein RhiirA4_482268 [Rhizophagus irregularis]|uniref:NrS-1 polymerase-like helicase domain-containing protein n=1 Tax=Rhizophagus irregularis TaxID=588596 RepID=A0A2I1HKU2_9GLOM|nr:hypothetical protein RhiirA4_482268 [Rhizophagus irregularis]